MSAHETLEHAEHAAHGGTTSKYIGVTMALIAALIAFCAALVGSERNELTRAMIDQTQAHAEYTAATAKFRAVMLELEKQRAKVSVAAGTPPGTPQAAGAAVDMKLVARFVGLASDYARERSITQKWADGYKPLVDAHFEAAEGYERGQLIAEFGIVLSSLAVLLGSRPVWLVSLVFAVICVGQLVLVEIHTKEVVKSKEGAVIQIEEIHDEDTKQRRAEGQDEATILELDPDSKIRNGIKEAREAREKAHKAGAPKAEAGEGGEHK